MDNYNQFLTKSVEIPMSEPSVVSSTGVQNAQTGSYVSQLGIDKQGNIVAIDSPWRIYERTIFSYNADNILNVVGFVPSEHFQLGDMVKLVQGGNTKYFYIIEVGVSTITVDAGQDYTYINEAISYFAISRGTRPSDHPQIFQFTTRMKIYTYTTGWNDDTARFDSKEAYYSMNGSIVTVTYNIFSISSFRASASQVTLYSPFQQRVQSQVNVGSTTALRTGSLVATTDLRIDMLWGWLNALPGLPAAAGELGVVISTPSGANFSSGAWGCIGSFTVAI